MSFYDWFLSIVLVAYAICNCIRLIINNIFDVVYGLDQIGYTYIYLLHLFLTRSTQEWRKLIKIEDLQSKGVWGNTLLQWGM
jgi:hypothetical protein